MLSLFRDRFESQRYSFSMQIKNKQNVLECKNIKKKANKHSIYIYIYFNVCIRIMILTKSHFSHAMFSIEVTSKIFPKLCSNSRMPAHVHKLNPLNSCQYFRVYSCSAHVVAHTIICNN